MGEAQFGNIQFVMVLVELRRFGVNNCCISLIAFLLGIGTREVERVPSFSMQRKTQLGFFSSARSKTMQIK
jgi:hypothetical protein